MFSECYFKVRKVILTLKFEQNSLFLQNQRMYDFKYNIESKVSFTQHHTNAEIQY